HAPCLLIDRHPALRMELAQRHVKHRLLLADLLQAIQGKIETFTDADSSSSYEAEGIGLQRVVLTELLLQALILVWGKRSGQVMVAKGEVLAANQIRGKGMTVVGQVTQQTAEQDQIQLAGCVAERRPLLAEKAEPAQQMRIATQLGGLMQVGGSWREGKQGIHAHKSDIPAPCAAGGWWQAAELGLPRSCPRQVAIASWHSLRHRQSRDALSDGSRMPPPDASGCELHV